MCLFVLAPALAKDDDSTFTYQEKPKFALKKPGKDWSFVDVVAERRDFVAKIDAQLQKLDEHKKKVEQEAESEEKKKKLAEAKAEQDRLQKLRKDTEQSALRCRLVREGEGKVEALGTIEDKPAAFVTEKKGRLDWDLKATERVGFRFKSTAASLRFQCLINGNALPEYIHVGAKGFHPAGATFVLENPKKDPGGAKTPFGRPETLGPSLPVFYGIWKDEDLWTIWYYRNGEEPARFEGYVEIPETAQADVHTFNIADPAMTLDKIKQEIEADIKKRDPAARIESPEPFKLFGADALRWVYHLKADGSGTDTYQVYLFKRDTDLVELRVIGPQEAMKKDSDLKKDATSIFKRFRIAW